MSLSLKAFALAALVGASVLGPLAPARAQDSTAGVSTFRVNPGGPSLPPDQTGARAYVTTPQTSFAPVPQAAPYFPTTPYGGYVESPAGGFLRGTADVINA